MTYTRFDIEKGESSYPRKSCLREKKSIVRKRPLSPLLVLVLITQQVLLWSGLYVATIFSYMVWEGFSDDLSFVLSILLLTTAGLSLIFLVLHSFSVTKCPTLRNGVPTGHRTGKTIQWLADTLLKISMMAWLIGCGVSITVLISNFPNCGNNLKGQAGDDSPYRNSACVLQGTSTGASLLCLISTTTIFVLVHKAPETRRCHILGVADRNVVEPSIYRIHHNPTKMGKVNFADWDSASYATTSQPSLTYLTDEREKAEAAVLLSLKYAADTPAISTKRSMESLRVPSTTSLTNPPLPVLPSRIHSSFAKGSTIYHAVIPPQRPAELPNMGSSRNLRTASETTRLSAGALAALEYNEDGTVSMAPASSCYSRTPSGKSYDSPSNDSLIPAASPIDQRQSFSQRLSVPKNSLRPEPSARQHMHTATSPKYYNTRQFSFERKTAGPMHVALLSRGPPNS